MDALAPGKLLGKYRVVRRLATGGMAEIYLAEARGIEGFAKHVVLKCILPQYASSETFVRLFLNEARVSATLDHPNIAGVYDIGEVDGTYFFAMEYLHGEDLGHILRELVTRHARLPLEHALTIGTGVAAGLHAAHEKHGSDGRALGIVHRDVSPSNVVVTFDGGVKLVDFGVAKLTAEAESTRTGTIRGKVSYMSPEQCNNDPVDRRSDIFSLGVLLYELTTMTRLFRAESDAATLKLVLETRVPRPISNQPDYPAELEAVLLRALARNRDERFGSARELQLALEEVARRLGVVTSAARLGEWMLGFFGARPEAWVNTPAHNPTPALPEPTPTGPGKRRLSLDRGPVLEPLPAEADPPAAAVVEKTPVPTTPAPPARLVARLLPLATLGAAFALTLGLVLRPQLQPPATVATAPPLVATPVAAVPAVEKPAAPAAPEPVPAPPAPAVAAKAPPARKPAPLSPVERFRSAFARKQSALLSCFARFGDPAAEAPPLTLRFHADEAGHVVSAELSPEELRETPLGSCLEEVALSTEFGAQPAPITFRIPVTVQRVGAAPKR
jgi:serine/threonine protein kinase